MKRPIKPLALGAGVVAVVGLVLAPIGASAVTQGPTSATVTMTVNPTLTMSVSNTASFTITPDAAGKASSAFDTVTVSTNNTAGYKLQLKDADTNTYLGTTTVTAHSGTPTVPTALTTANTWGYRLDGAMGFGAGPTAAQTDVAALTETKWAGITSANVDIKSTSGTAANDANKVFYAAYINSSVPTGAWTDTVQYTAVTN